MVTSAVCRNRLHCRVAPRVLGDLRVWRKCILFQDPGHRLQPPCGAAAGLVPLVVECDGDAAKCAALAAQIPNLGQRGLLGGVGLQMTAAFGQAEAKLDVPNAVPGIACVTERRVFVRL